MVDKLVLIDDDEAGIWISEKTVQFGFIAEDRPCSNSSGMLWNGDQQNASGI